MHGGFSKDWLRGGSVVCLRLINADQQAITAMTQLSINLNKIALLRNARGTGYPDVLCFAEKLLALGVRGLTVHPRQDERHITRQDTRELAALVRDYEGVEFNVEGYPGDAFLELIEATRPDQCTLVPDSPQQLTSDHGWDVHTQGARLQAVCKRLADWGVRSSLFMDPDEAQINALSGIGADRIELYTEAYARAFGGAEADAVLSTYRNAAACAQSMGLGVNAGHDLNLGNLARFLEIPDVLEVSIGHAFTVECIEHGMRDVIARYLAICAA